MARRVLLWEPDPVEVRALALAPFVAAKVEADAHLVKREIERIAPKGPTGRYSRSIVVGAFGERDGTIGVDVGSDDFAAHIVEFGSVNNPPYRPLHRGAMGLGLRVQD